MNQDNVFAEGDSDVIDEEHEHDEHGGNNSFENIKRVKKGPGSLDDCDEADNVDRQEFIKGIIGDKHLVGDS